MNGAQAMIRTLVDAGVDTCFTNPGTSEMHFVAALDTVEGVRSILGLFEGVVTGAADGYARMADKPAATLLHLGPGLGNGLANLHNARRARSPMVNIVGDHATYHHGFDAPLESDIETVAANVSPWIRASKAPGDIGRDTAEAVAAAFGPPGQVATLILPADVSWEEGGEPAPPLPRAGRRPVDDDVVGAVAKTMVSGEPCVLLLGGTAVRADALTAASRVARATGARLFCETFPTRQERGAGVPNVDRLAYLAEFTQAQLAGASHLVLVDAKSPVSFFAYPGKASDLVPDECEVHVLAAPGDDAATALAHLADLVADGVEPELQPASRPDLPTGPTTGEAVANVVGALLPEGAVVVDEANTSGIWIPGATAGAPRHDWLTLTGGAIGYGLPAATGAAVACPDRKVVCLEADGSAMYTIQALWTQAREGLDVTTVIFNNRSYAILNMELTRVGAGEPGPKALDMLDLSRPDLDFVALAQGMGVDAVRPSTAEELADAFRRAVDEPGPHLIDVLLA